jgi:hypothetical protein
VSDRHLVLTAIALLVFAAPAGPSSSRLTEDIDRKVLPIPASQFQVV